jgi:uncharacterized membrane protein
MTLDKPHIEVKMMWWEWPLMVLSGLLIAYSFVHAWWVWDDLPERIATHFNTQGEADGWSDRGSLFTLPFIMLGTYGMMVAIWRFVKPWNYNIPTDVTKENAASLYALTRGLIVWMTLAIGVTSILGVSHIVSYNIGTAFGGSWLLPLLLAMYFLPIVVYLILMVRIKKEGQ